MAIDAGRVGVRKDQVDAYGRIVLTDELLAQIIAALQDTEGEPEPVVSDLQGES